MLRIDFYDETISIKIPESFQKLKQELANEYSMDLTDVEELIMYYKDSEDKISIQSEMDYEKALEHFKSEFDLDKEIYKIFVEVGSTSKLYKREFENTKIFDEKLKHLPVEENKSEVQKYQEQLKWEILEKEKQLKELLEKERLERERRLRIKMEIEKREEEEKSKTQNEQIKKEKEEHDRMEKELLKENLHKTITEIVNSNMERIKAELINKTVMETSRAIENSFKDPRNAAKQNLTVHRRVKCDGCGMFPIVGVRYKCTACSNFDYCERCEEANGETHAHPFIKYRMNPWEGKRCPFRRNMCGLKRDWNGTENQHESHHAGRKHHYKDQPNFFSLIKNKFSDIFSCKNANEKGFPNKFEEEVKNLDEKIEKNNQEDQNLPRDGKLYEEELEEIRMGYDLNHISDEKIIEALNKTGGDIIPALMLLF